MAVIDCDMPCYKPLKGYYSRTKTASGKRKVVFSASDGFIDRPITIPCGQCVGCRLEKSRVMALRCVHEASLHTSNCFVTLTYRNECLPENGSLDLDDITKFWKRLRDKIAPQKIRYFYCGEYGDTSNRPHYHAIIFGYQPSDLVFYKSVRENEYYISPFLESVWNKGYVVIGNVTFESAAYTARYCMKKINGKMLDSTDPETGLKPYERYNSKTGEIVNVTPEFANSSRRPGIASEWFRKYKRDIYPKDFVTVRGVQVKPPRYYDNMLEVVDPKQYEEVKTKRLKKAFANKKDNTSDRLDVKEKVKLSKIKNLRRVLK